MADDPIRNDLWRGSLRAARDEARRSKLLDAALELYGTIGYRATTVQALCRSASVSSRSFYELYSHQEKLLTDLYSVLNAEVLAGMVSVRPAAGDRAETIVHEMLARALDPMLTDERKARVLEVESVGVSEELEHQRRVAYRTFALAIDDAFRALAGADLIRAAPAEPASLILVGGITELLVQRIQDPEAGRSPRAEFLGRIAAVIMRLIT